MVLTLTALALVASCGGTTATTATANGLPDAPDGLRWVGERGVVVAVPDWWTTGETQCGAPVADTVYADAAAQYDCDDPADPGIVREVSALAVLDGTCCLVESLFRTMVPIEGRSDVVEQPGCEEWFEGVCRHLFALAGTDVVFAVTMTDDGGAAWEEVRDSVRLLPDGMTTVPLSVGGEEPRWTPEWGAEPPRAERYADAVRAAGLRVETVTAERDDHPDADDLAMTPGSLLGIEPAPGSVIEADGIVTLTVSGRSLS